ncbi:hypothetical protein GFS24_00340 [Chitinophaga sp. SYP-B3965]|uniref:sensor histidine kinase n=1 Tax=Chitinophaga sp. SYP-B3965 TaxID=2663120 RepID=UPI00129973DA|nr:HAMP domain-containing sensor histidine kinase [Chitinophaga sp. SYP-B3965]MRG43537.1 hypothetical protein [Chitinophaga sp. SYP-B3965]
MKLLHRTTRDFLLATIVILLITGAGLYLFLQDEVTAEMNEQLALQAATVSRQLEEGNDAHYLFTEISKTTDPVRLNPVYGDTLLYDPIQKVTEDYHYLDIVQNIRGENYHIKVMTTYIGWDEYFKMIFTALLGTTLLLAVSSVLITYFTSRKIWKPFFMNLESIKNYSVSDKTALKLYASPIKEFSELEVTLKDMTERSQREYKALREFTENASHEIQTPLGIIQSKLDRISQLSVSEEMARHITQAKSGVDRLKKMNKNLLLLAKLDNNTFADKQMVWFDDVISQHLETMEELFSVKEVAVSTHILRTPVLSNPYLSEILVSNLVSNALRYTEEGGMINIMLTTDQFSVSNTGAELDFPAELLFDRFRKSTKNIQSTGLGLAIVQQICQLNSWKISYRYADQQHVFTVNF